MVGQVKRVSDGSSWNVSILNKSFTARMIQKGEAINGSAPELLNRFEGGADWKGNAMVHPWLGKLNHFELVCFEEDRSSSYVSIIPCCNRICMKQTQTNFTESVYSDHLGCKITQGIAASEKIVLLKLLTVLISSSKCAPVRSA